MNKNDLVAAVAGKTGLSKADSASAVNSVLDAITEALTGGDDVRLVGFGTFSVTQRRARAGRNPRTGNASTFARPSNRSLRPQKALRMLSQTMMMMAGEGQG